MKTILQKQKISYSKQLAFIDQEHYRLLKMDFFDKKGDLLKTLILED